jgi:hypothetical protein
MTKHVSEVQIVKVLEELEVAPKLVFKNICHSK